MAAHSDVWPDDETESETDDDSWFYASVKRYKNLHMFDLQQATRSIEWIGNGSICVAGFDNPKRNEILELTVPETLISSTKDEVLSKNRDFKMCGGGFTNRSVWNLKHIPNTTKIATSETGHNAIHIYQLGRDKSDIIEHVAEVANSTTNLCDTPIVDVSSNSQLAVFGTRLNDICLADIQVGKVQTSFPSDEKNDSPAICQLCLLSNSVVVACVKETGQIFLVDLRESQAKISESSQATLVEANSNNMTWTCALASGSWGSTNGNGSDSSNLVGCLSSMGNFICFDIRNLKEACTTVSLPHKMAKDSSTNCFINLQFAPHNPGIISVSGYDGNICLYEISPWHSDKSVVRGSGACLSPLFIHDGHAAGKKTPVPGMLVMTHCWHPFMPNVVLSAGTDKSLHAWEWQVEPE